MLDCLHRPARGGFVLLRLMGTLLTLAGLLIAAVVTAFSLLAWFTGGVPFVSNMQLGVTTITIVVGALVLIAAGQLLHLSVGIWRALKQHSSR